MKSKLTIFLAFFLMLFLAAFSQAPNSFKYQSMVRKADGSVLANQSVKVKISILKGSTSGTLVYSEVHSPTSNTFGIVNLNISEGSDKSGAISTIDWSLDSYFVKVEMDETGGSNYTLSSVSQLLSVPYAINANSANSIDWAKVQNKPSFFSGNYNDLTNKPTLDGAETKITAGTNVTITGTGTVASPYVINSSNSGTSHYVGELYGGGVVFYVDNSGQHGLVCSLNDLSTSQEWSNVNNVLIGITAQSTWDGLSNSNSIVSQVNHTSSAAKLCVDYTVSGYDDWYLPAIWELNLMSQSIFQINRILESDSDNTTTGISSGYYWSSTERDNLVAGFWLMNRGYASTLEKTNLHYVRAARRF